MLNITNRDIVLSDNFIKLSHMFEHSFIIFDKILRADSSTLHLDGEPEKLEMQDSACLISKDVPVNSTERTYEESTD